MGTANEDQPGEEGGSRLIDLALNFSLLTYLSLRYLRAHSIYIF